MLCLQTFKILLFQHYETKKNVRKFSKSKVAKISHIKLA